MSGMEGAVSDLAFAGTGMMGRAMVKRLLSQGFGVAVWNRSPLAADELVTLGARRLSSIEEAFETGLVLSMLANDAASTAVFSSEVLNTAPPGSVHVNMATISVQAAQLMTRQHADVGLGYVAVPVLGRPPVAEKGQLNLLAAGDRTLVASLGPVLSALGQQVWDFGDVPAQANAAKICMNYLLIHALQAMGEAITVAELHGIDQHKLVDLMAVSFFPGPVYGTYGPQIAARRYLPAAFTTELGLKDFELMAEAAASVGIRLPTETVLRSVFQKAIDLGYSQHDWASIAEVTRDQALSSPRPLVP